MGLVEKAISDTAPPLCLGEHLSCPRDAKAQAVGNTHSTLGREEDQSQGQGSGLEVEEGEAASKT